MLNTLFISAAYAQEAAGAPPSPFAGLLPLVLIFVVFYFLLIRPQQKKFKRHQEMIAAVKVNDKVITAGGVHGKVSKVEDNTVKVKIAEDVEITVEKSTLSQVITKEAANDNKA